MMLASFCSAYLDPGVSIPGTLELHFGLLSSRRNLSSYTLKAISPSGPLSHPKVPPRLPNVHRGWWEGSNGSHGLTQMDNVTLEQTSPCLIHISPSSPGVPFPGLRTHWNYRMHQLFICWLPPLLRKNPTRTGASFILLLSFLYSQCPGPRAGSLLAG